MKRFRDRPIKQKLMALIIVITSAALLLSGIGIVIADSVLFRGYLERDLSTFAQVIADNSTASLAFDDPQSASEILGALRARPHIVEACLFQADGTRFAQYVRSGTTTQCQNSQQDEIRADAGRLTVTRPVVQRGSRLGSLVIAYDLGELIERIQLYGVTVLAVLVVSTLLVVLLSSKLRTMFVTPILELARTTDVVSKTKDYNARAAKFSNDEVGNLAGAFNEMLAGIESRDLDLRKTVAELQQAFDRMAELNRELQRSNEELARSNQDLERFAFIASHDMQEPLRMVTVYSQLLVKECPAEFGEASTYRDYIVGGTRRMRELIADLLAYVEITTAPGQMKMVDLNATVEKVKANLAVQIEESDAVVSAGPLPRISAHEAHMISLFQNLIGNGIKYRSELPPRINISAEDSGDCYQLVVADNGIGIEPEYHSKIFVAFTRLHGKDVPGTGIGLAICQRVVERYGGRIWVNSELGKGAAFTFTFPKLEQENRTNGR